MKIVGLLVFIVGIFVAGSYAARPGALKLPEGQEPTPKQRLVAWKDVALGPFAVGLLLMLGGAVIARRRPAASGEMDAKELKTGGRRSPEELLKELADAVERFDVSALSDSNKAPIADRIEGLLEEEVAQFLDAREELISKLGLNGFAQMIGDFATFERNLARAWSALTDSAYEEVPPALQRAGDALARARKAFAS
ncbi:MAG: hypothetical protein H6716_05525 [Polyangiaceae bacterium]|nr:hypothetical protein [Polyangiaceae bacterium]